MTVKTFDDMYAKRVDFYSRLTDGSASVDELMFKIRIAGPAWTSLDWTLYMYYLFRHAHAGFNDDKPSNKSMLLTDIVKSIDETDLLDDVVTNRKVLDSMVSFVELPLGSFVQQQTFMTGVLAHVFYKFPEIWNMNFMWTRHHKGRAAGTRTHRLAFTIDLVRPPSYYESDAFRADFVLRYWNLPRILKFFR